ncbi:uncharacterized protein SPPG_04019 [Spizellomyces punctatus DAOM BR117]|uniref:DUF647 domain-containing protein n=1 Tax=Spizellomyces punctatus (strain DAOM BR117) TaxID=645134 RepID=A0A0L0HJA3_SPIPD|nr:uncharacterized protein SPPG_04019 [Spizellomyces punctatus DAOM BR117]KND00919.1 hypothetical protein SPPG_04019 [Spizellomyces punctatus DAOM BR117]|eukprot:XP_016608958.1 hypothetical protein SPPG_04019 [Spizellomyces punctatus DAOM BR117]
MSRLLSLSKPCSLRWRAQQSPRPWRPHILSYSTNQKDNGPSLSKPLLVRQRVHRGENTVWTVMQMQSPAFVEPSETLSQRGWTVDRQVINHQVNASTGAHVASASTAVKLSSPRSIANFLVSQVRDKLAMGFLPKGYPHSVTPDYTPYTIYSFLHSVSGTLTGTLSTQALLHALGMGAAAAAGLAATTNWIIKDGFGLLGGVIYAGATANRFDSSPKRYRFLAAVAIQVATLAELLTPLFPHLFVPMASVSNICKNIGWLAASATRASMHKGFSKEDNLGDVTAKAGAQATTAGLLGTGGGILLSWAFGTAPMSLMTIFVPLCAANMWFAYRANEAVVTRSINLERCELIMHDRVRHALNGHDAPPPRLPTPEHISAQEHFIFPYRSIFSTPLSLEPSLQRRLNSLSSPLNWQAFLSGSMFGSPGHKEEYRVLIVPGPTGGKKQHSIWTRFTSTAPSNSGVHVCCWYTENAKSEDMLKGFYHACVLRMLCESRTDMSEETRMHLVRQGYEVVERSFGDLMESLRAEGWELSHTHLGDRNARIDVGHST